MNPPEAPKCAGARTVNHVEGALEELELWELEPLYMVVLPTPEVVEELFVQNRYVDIDYSLLELDNVEPRRVCLGLVHRLMMQQFILKLTRQHVFPKHGGETQKRDEYLAKLTKDYEGLKSRFRSYHGRKVVGTEDVTRFRPHALRIENSWMREVRVKHADIDLEYETVWL